MKLVLFVSLLLAGVASGQEPTGKKIALLVGVNKYDKRTFRDLEYAERDVTELAPLLEKAGYETHLLTGSASGAKRATLKNIEATIEAVLGGRTKRDLLLVALAGHGLQIEVAPDGKELQAESFYCPVDAESGNPKTMLPMGKLFDEIRRRGGGQNLVLVDACREDPTRGRGGMDGSTVKTLPEGVAVLFGCRSGQKTYETKKASGGHGVFFHFVLEGLRGEARNERGDITWDRLVEFVRDRVDEGAPQLIGDKSIVQTPNLIANLPGRSPVLLKADRQPALLVAPFDERTAKSRQADWAKHLGKSSALEENSLKMKLVLIPPGEFMMGATEEEIERTLKDFPTTKREWLENEKRHRVRIAQPFYLAAHEVTKRQFREFVNAKDYKTEAESDGKGGFGYDEKKDKLEGRDAKYNWRNTGFTQGNDHPVVNVSWNDAVEFCKWLSEKEGKEYRLPSEAEWEYACRAGTTTAYFGGDDPETLATYGNVADGTLKAKVSRWNTIKARDGYVFTAPVGEFRANAFGLHDMHGNVWEWCRDSYRKDYERLDEDDPVNLVAGSYRVIRGGSWYDTPSFCRSARRINFGPTTRSIGIGFRVARAR